nr:hypothetical protein [Tanacetum cinerariifolium]
MMSPGGSIVASLENVNGFLAVNTPPDDLIRTHFEQEGVIPKVMLHIFEEFVLLLGRHPFYNKVPRMVVCKIGKPLGFNTLFGEEERSIIFKKTCHWPGYLRKVLFESSIEAGMTKETTDTLDGSGMRGEEVVRRWRWCCMSVAAVMAAVVAMMACGDGGLCSGGGCMVAMIFEDRDKGDGGDDVVDDGVGEVVSAKGGDVLSTGGSTKRGGSSSMISLVWEFAKEDQHLLVKMTRLVICSWWR